MATYVEFDNTISACYYTRQNADEVIKFLQGEFPHLHDRTYFTMTDDLNNQYIMQRSRTRGDAPTVVASANAYISKDYAGRIRVYDPLDFIRKFTQVQFIHGEEG